MENTTLVIKKEFKAEPEKVFRAWADPEEVAQWYGPEGFTNTVHEFDFREGGKYRVTMKAPDETEHTVVGEFKTVDEPNKLSMTWKWEASDMAPNVNDETTVTVLFEKTESGTVMTMTHEGFAEISGRDSHNEGWTSSFVKLDRVVG